MGDVVDGFEDEAEIFFVFGPSQDVISEVVSLDFGLAFCDHDELLHV